VPRGTGAVAIGEARGEARGAKDKGWERIEEDKARDLVRESVINSESSS
jgi:hypothetical protein